MTRRPGPTCHWVDGALVRSVGPLSDRDTTELAAFRTYLQLRRTGIPQELADTVAAYEAGTAGGAALLDAIAARDPDAAVEQS